MAGDTLLVFDRQLGRINYIDAEGNVGRSQELQQYVTEFYQVSAGFVVQYDDPLAQPPASVHLFDNDWAYLKALEPGEPRVLGTSYLNHTREIAPSPRDGLWISRRDDYVLRWTSLHSDSSRIVEGGAGWFDVRPDERRNSIIDIVVDAEDRVWVMLGAVHQGLQPPPGWDLTKPLTPVMMHEAFDTVVEVWRADGTLITGIRLANSLQGFAGPGWAYGLIEDESGIQSIRVWPVLLRQED